MPASSRRGRRSSSRFSSGQVESRDRTTLRAGCFRQHGDQRRPLGRRGVRVRGGLVDEAVGAAMRVPALDAAIATSNVMSLAAVVVVAPRAHSAPAAEVRCVVLSSLGLLVWMGMAIGASSVHGRRRSARAGPHPRQRLADVYGARVDFELSAAVLAFIASLLTALRATRPATARAFVDALDAAGAVQR